MRQAIGIDIGGTKIRTAIVNSDGSIAADQEIATPATPEAVVTAIEQAIAKFNSNSIETIGIGIPGRVDSATGEIFSGGFVDLSRANLRSRLTAFSGKPVFLDNDASMALVAEARVGAARGLSHIVMLTIGTGIGGAVMMNRNILHGRASAGQLGHITVDVNGAACLCGRKGCLETTSSGTALRKLLAAAQLEFLGAQELLQRTDAKARSVIDEWAKPLRAGIDSLVAAFDPQRIVLGGGLGAAAVEAMTSFPALSPWYQCDVAAALLGNDAGVIGAALASQEQAT